MLIHPTLCLQSGLFEDIADGLKRAKVMVACVSDEVGGIPQWIVMYSWQMINVNPCRAEFSLGSIEKYICISIISQHWDSTSGWNHSLRKTHDEYHGCWCPDYISIDIAFMEYSSFRIRSVKTHIQSIILVTLSLIDNVNAHYLNSQWLNDTVSHHRSSSTVVRLLAYHYYNASGQLVILHCPYHVVYFILQYAKSKNCQMEMRFASVSLKVPIIIAVVGTGYKWESTEVSWGWALLLGNCKIFFFKLIMAYWRHMAT